MAQKALEATVNAQNIQGFLAELLKIGVSREGHDEVVHAIVRDLDVHNHHELALAVSDLAICEKRREQQLGAVTAIMARV